MWPSAAAAALVSHERTVLDAEGTPLLVHSCQQVVPDRRPPFEHVRSSAPHCRGRPSRSTSCASRKSLAPPITASRPARAFRGFMTRRKPDGGRIESTIRYLRAGVRCPAWRDGSVPVAHEIVLGDGDTHMARTGTRCCSMRLTVQGSGGRHPAMSGLAIDGGRVGNGLTANVGSVCVRNSSILPITVV